jgi:RimJ/RimL family protein N-acetyltransferase
MSAAQTVVLETERLVLSKLTTADAPFVLELLNDEAFVRHIGDRGVRTLDDACGYILAGPVAMYDEHGFGLWKVELCATGEPIGICGLLKRETLPNVDLGFALLPRFRSQGYGVESARAVMGYGKRVLGLQRIVAITSLDNETSANLLNKVGLRFERLMELGDKREKLRLFAWNLE